MTKVMAAQVDQQENIYATKWCQVSLAPFISSAHAEMDENWISPSCLPRTLNEDSTQCLTQRPKAAEN